MTAGRPTKYNKRVLQKAEAYIEQHEEHGDAVPIAAGLACYLGVCKRTLYSWADDNEEFLHTLDRLNSKQEKVLTSKGLTSEFNSTITKLILCNHGYSDKQESQSNGRNKESLFAAFAEAARNAIPDP